MSEDHLIRHCAPTLAGLKSASLFTCDYASKEQMRCCIRQLNRRLAGKGLRIIPLRFSDSKALIYIYRPQKLTADLNTSEAVRLLERSGYCKGSCEQCLAQLIKRVRQQKDFPHEIGLFLGYPPEDVCGFMENRACNCKCVGCWKVYGDVEAAQKKFAQYKKCTQVYCDRWASGTDIERLTVSDRAG